MRYIWILILLVFVSGCDECTQQVIQVSFPATITRGNETQSLILSDQVTDTNIRFDDFDRFFRTVRNADESAGATEIVWTVAQGFSSTAFLGFALRVPVSDNTTLTVDPEAFNGGGWGVGNGEFGTTPVHPVRAGFHFGAFQAESVQGTVEVLDVEPLRLRVDLNFFANGSSLTYRVRGDMAFSATESDITCD